MSFRRRLYVGGIFRRHSQKRDPLGSICNFNNYTNNAIGGGKARLLLFALLSIYVRNLTANPSDP